MEEGKRRIAVCVTAALLLLPMERRPATAETLFLLDTLRMKLLLFDSAAPRLVGALRARNYPRAFIATPDGATIYLANTGLVASDEGTGTVSVFQRVIEPPSPQDQMNGNPEDSSRGGFVAGDSPGNYRALAEIGVGAEPYDLALDLVAHRLYVANHGTRSITVVDVEKHTTIGTVSLPGAPSSLALAPATARLYVTIPERDTVAVVGLKELSVVEELAANRLPAKAVVTEDGRLCVANAGSGTVSVIDTRNNMLLGTIAVGDVPIDVRPTKEGLVVANADHTLSLISLKSLREESRISLDIVPDHLAVSASGTVFAGEFTSGNVKVVDLATRSVAATIDHAWAP